MEHRLAFDALHREIHKFGQRVRRAVQHNTRHSGQRVPQRFIQRRDAPGAASVRQHPFNSPGHGGDIGHVFGARTALLLLPAAQKHGGQIVAAAHIQRAHALGRVDLMPGHRVAVDGRSVQPLRDLAPRLYAVDVYGRAAVFFLHRFGQRGHVQNGTDLIVYMHGCDEGCFGADGPYQRPGVHMAGGVRPHDGDAPALFFQRGHGVLHAGVFVARDDNVVRPGGARLHRAQNSKVIALGTAGREHDLPRLRAQGRGHRFPRAGQNELALRAGRVQRGRVGVMGAQHRVRCVGHGVSHACGGGVIQIMQRQSLPKTIYKIIILPNKVQGNGKKEKTAACEEKTTGRRHRHIDAGGRRLFQKSSHCIGRRPHPDILQLPAAGKHGLRRGEGIRPAHPAPRVLHCRHRHQP